MLASEIPAIGTPAAAPPYLAKLNTEQRRAVEHGCAALGDAPPMLIIAGAGSGKTNTLANRVGHLIVCGVDPRRMMLLTAKWIKQLTVPIGVGTPRRFTIDGGTRIHTGRDAICCAH